MQKFVKLKLILWLSVAVLVGQVALAQGQTATPTATPSKAKSGGRDPFDDPSAKKTSRPASAPRPPATPKVAAVAKPVKPVPAIVAPLDINARINIYKAKKQEALLRQEAPPKPTTAFLIQELEVAGIFRTPRGYAAMVHAGPIKLSYIIYPGEPVYDGQLVAIDEDSLIFRRHLKWTDGRDEVRVERKGLRPPAPLADPLTAEKTSPQAAPVAPAPALPAGAAPSPVTPPVGTAPAGLPPLTPPSNPNPEPPAAPPVAPSKPAEKPAPKKPNPKTKAKAAPTTS